MKYGLSYTLIRRVTWFWKKRLLHKASEINTICSFLDKKDNSRILDYGCDFGFLLDIIKNRYPSKNFDLCGSDINQYALKYARKKYQDFTFFNVDSKFFDNEKFDVIILSHVLEHMHNRDELIRNLKKLLNKEGILIIAIPQERIRGDCTIIELLYNVIRFRFENPHVVKINYQDLNELLVNNGLYIKEQIYTHFLYPFKSGKRRVDSLSFVVTCKNKRP